MKFAVTGGMGTGKSCVAEALALELGAMGVSADLICRDLLEIGKPGYQQVRNHFSADLFLADGQIDRPALRKVIFSDSEFRGKLDALLHPLVRQELFSCAAVAESKGIDLVAEVPLLFENGWQGDFDFTLVVFADSASCIARIVRRDLVTECDAMESISSQMPLVEKCRFGDRVIDNSGSFAETLVALKQFVLDISSNPLFHGKGDSMMKKA